MNTDDCIQIKSEPFESSEDLFPLENRNDPDVTFNGFSYRRPPGNFNTFAVNGIFASGS